MHNFLQDDKPFDEYTLYIARNWVKNMRERYKEFLIPIFHSSQVLLTEDSSSYRHDTLALICNSEPSRCLLLVQSDAKILKKTLFFLVI